MNTNVPAVNVVGMGAAEIHEFTGCESGQFVFPSLRPQELSCPTLRS